VRRFFDTTKRTVAYLDAAGGTFVLRRSWTLATELRSLTEYNLRKFFRPEQDRKSLAIDPRERLHMAVEEGEQVSAFLQQAGRAGQVGSPALTHFIMAALAALFVGMVASSRGWLALKTPSTEVLMNWGALYGPAVRAGQWWRIFTCGTVHIGVVHLLFNLMALYVFGSVLEVLQGRWRLGIILVGSVVCGSLARLAWNPMILSAGASGGLFGLIGALLGVVIRYRKSFPPALARSYRKWLVTVLLYNAVFLIHPRIDGVAHAGGFVGGLLMGLILCRSPVKVAWPAAWTWPALAAMVLGVCLLGQHAIRNIPVSSLEVIELQIERERLAALAELSALVQSFGEGPERLNKAYNDARRSTSSAERKRIVETIRSEILPSVQDANVPARLRELAARIQSPKHPLMGDLDALLTCREQYCAAVAGALGQPRSAYDPAMIDLWFKVASAQTRLEMNVRMGALWIRRGLDD
jgi:rhomboid protease GluP